MWDWDWMNYYIYIQYSLACSALGITTTTTAANTTNKEITLALICPAAISIFYKQMKTFANNIFYKTIKENSFSYNSIWFIEAL